MPNLGANFYPKLVEMCKEVGVKPEDLIAVMRFESGLNPAAYNKDGGASGLIQFMPSTLKNLGYSGTNEEFRRLSGEEQIPWIKKYIGDKHTKFGSAAKYYVANMFPVALNLQGVKNEDPNTPILEKNPESLLNGKSKKYADIGANVSAAFEMAAYKSNSGLDHGAKGVITYGDLMKTTSDSKKSPVYQSAIAQMEQATGYKPSTTSQYDSVKEPSMVATKTKQPIHTLSVPTSLMSILEQINQQLNITASMKKLYKIALPNNDILIQIDAPDYSSAIEFSRILCAALDDNLLSTSYPHTDGTKVEIECSISGPNEVCFSAVKDMTETISDIFAEATKKIGKIIVNANCIMNKKSSYHPINVKIACINYRIFQLKFISKE